MARRRKSRSAKRSRAAKKAARTRKRNKAIRRARALKNFRKGRRKGSRKSSAKRRRRGGTVFRPVLRRRRRWYAAPGSKIKGRRINPRRRRRYGRRRNPGTGLSLKSLFPTSLGQVKEFAVLGAGGAIGFLGVSSINSLLDRFGVDNLKSKIENPILYSVANAVESTVSTFILAGVARMFIKKPEFTKGIFIGGATKAVLDIATPLLGKLPGPVADAAMSGYQEQLSGYQEQLNGFQTGGVAGFQANQLGYIDQQLTRVALETAAGVDMPFGG